MSALPSYLLRTSKGYFFRIRIPKPLQTIFNKKELKKALHATDKSLAVRQAILYAANALTLFDQLQEVQLAKLPFINDTAIIIKQNGAVTEYHIDPRYRAAEIQLLIDKGLVQTANKLETLHISDQTKISAPLQNSQRLSVAIQDYFRAMTEIEHRWKPEYIKEQKPLFDLLLEALTDRDLSTITREDARGVFEKLKRLPVNRNKDARLKGRTLEQLLLVPNVRPISTKTLNLHMMKITAFFNWLLREDRLSKNQFLGLHVAEEVAPRDQKKTFNTDDLKQIFSHPCYTAHKYNHPHEYSMLFNFR
jgi:hypothetical protein